MILEIFLGLSIIMVAISWYLIVISLRRINAYEDFITQFQQVVEYATNQMKQVDADGHYTSDDETGFFFDQLKALQNLLNDIFEEEDTSATQKEKEK
jgi:biopolymer transport protein ExbB/TolQ